MIWTRYDIQNARKINLVVILKKLGYKLQTIDKDNYTVNKFTSVVVKNNYWFCKSTRNSGNAIDFFTKIEKKSFMETMDILLKNKEE